MPILTTGLITAQILSSLRRIYKDGQAAKEVREFRENDKRDALSEGQRRDSERFNRSCLAYLELERLIHEDTVKDIETSFRSTFEKGAHNTALANYPLTISPYLIKHSILSFDMGGDSPDIRPLLFCVLTNSNDDLFNQICFPYVDSFVNEHIAQFWNACTSHTVCYYENTWKRGVSFTDEHHMNLMTLLRKTPLLLVSPYLAPSGDSRKVVFKIRFMGDELFTIVPKTIPEFQMDKTATVFDSGVRELLDRIGAWLVSIIGFFADIYYWIEYQYAPIFPSIIADQSLFVEETELIEFFKQSYVDFLKRVCAPDDVPGGQEAEEPSVFDDMHFLSARYSPEKTMGLLASVTSLTQSGPSSEEAIWAAFSYLYWARSSGPSIKSYEDVDVRLLTPVDMSLVQDAISIARGCESQRLVDSMAQIIRRQIEAKPQ